MDKKHDVCWETRKTPNDDGFAAYVIKTAEKDKKKTKKRQKKIKKEQELQHSHEFRRVNSVFYDSAPKKQANIAHMYDAGLCIDMCAMQSTIGVLFRPNRPKEACKHSKKAMFSTYHSKKAMFKA